MSKRQYLRFTITFETEVDDLEVYQASSIAEAAKNQRRWLDEDPSSLVELLECASGGATVAVEGYEL